MTESTELLRQYAEHRSEPAFAEFVRRQVDFVYGCALRRVGGDAQLAEDIVQRVFVAAARNAAALSRHPVLAGWLYTTTRNHAVQLVRAERRRHAREEAAMNDPQESQSAVDWQRLRPVLDDALDDLPETDRRAVLLRFFEGKSFAEVGAALRLAENTARMRVNRALEKLAARLARRGVSSTAAALALALAHAPATAAPAGLAAAATGTALAGAATTTAIFFMGMTKLQVGVAAGVLAAGIAGVTAQSRSAAALAADVAAAQQQAAAVSASHAELERLRDAVRQQEQEAQARDAALAETQRQVAVLEQSADARRQAARMDAARVAAAGAKTQVYDVRAVDVVPRPSFQVAPTYPFTLRRAGQTGEAVVDFIVDASGVVQNVTIAKSTHPELAAAAAEAVRLWQFKPGQKAGAAVATHLQVPIIFTLKGEGKESGAARDGEPPTSSTWF